jgi:hypothetical protein
VAERPVEADEGRLEHDDAPVLLKFSIGEFRRLVAGLPEVTIVAERFPGEVAAARRLERRGLQRPVCRHVQPLPRRSSAASAGILPRFCTK